MSEEVIVITPDNKYVALLNFDDTLVPLLASAEMTQDAILADQIFKKLLAETRIEQGEDGGDITRFHPDLKWWFEQKTKILKEIAKLNVQAGVKEADLTIDIVKILLQDKHMLTPADRQRIGKQLMKRRMKKDDGD